MLFRMLERAEKERCSALFTMTESDSMRNFLKRRGFHMVYEGVTGASHVSHHLGSLTAVWSTYGAARE
jgi:N-acetylglutamate synthase-like GNAT family acetyltransferase